MATADHSGATPWVEKYRPKSLKDVSHQSEVIATLQNATETGRLPHLLFYGPPGSGKVSLDVVLTAYSTVQYSTVIIVSVITASGSYYSCSLQLLFHYQTSVALALCRQLWHPSQWRRRVLELNASDERGISVVRDKIKHFASLSVGSASSGTKSAASFFNKKKDGNEMDVEEPAQQEEETYPNPPFKIIILDEADTVTPDAQAALRRIIVRETNIPWYGWIVKHVSLTVFCLFL
jgi:replication factor C subunit 2/4